MNGVDIALLISAAALSTAAIGLNIHTAFVNRRTSRILAQLTGKGRP